jgi:hypothetical protein
LIPRRSEDASQESSEQKGRETAIPVNGVAPATRTRQQREGPTRRRDDGDQQASLKGPTMIRITMLTPDQGEPIWYRKAWKGVHIAWNTVAHGELVVVPTNVAIAGLHAQNPGAAYFWHCCLAAMAGPMMTFPRGICEVISDPIWEKGSLSRR